VIGPGAGPQGAAEFYNGGGSSHIPETGVKSDVVSPLAGIQQRTVSNGDTVVYADGSNAVRAEATAAAADVAVVFVGAEDSESVDRSTMDLSSASAAWPAHAHPLPWTRTA
jgi:beta-glucosidase